MNPDKRKRVALILLNKQYLISWVDSGNIDRMVDTGDFDISVFAPKQISELMPKQEKYKSFQIESIEPTNAATHLVAMNWVAMREKSSTFRFALQRTFRTDYWFWVYQLGLLSAVKQSFKNLKTVVWNTRKKHLTVLYFFRPFRVFGNRYQKALGKSSVLPLEIRNKELDWLIIPCNAIDELITDYISEAKQLGIQTLVAIDNWDNLTSKSVYVIKPDHLTVMGRLCVEHARRIHEIPEDQVHPFGLPRFDGYRRNLLEQPIARVKTRPQVLYAGFSMAHSEKRVVDAIANFLDAKYGTGEIEVVYRPHPIPIPRIDPYELTNLNISIHDHGNLERTSLPGLTNGLVDSLNSASVVVGAPTTLMLESMILGRPCVIDVTEDVFHRTNASNSAQNFVHMKDLLAVEQLKIGHTIDEVVKCVDELLSIGSKTTKYNMTHLYDVSAPLYIDQLMSFFLQA